jgi:predicted DNA-binding antitoxin AbrB/MazE fold protein
MKTIHAVFENGVFRPIEPVELPEGTPVDVLTPPLDADSPGPMSEGLARIYAILGERYESGYTDTAERHNEHQP